MSQGMQNGLLSTQLQLPLDKELLLMVTTCLAALRKQHLLATTATEQPSHNVIPFKEQRLIHSPESRILSKHHTARMTTLVSQLSTFCDRKRPSRGAQPQTFSATHVGFDAVPRQIVSKRYRVVREPFTAPLVQQSSTNTRQSRRRRHRVQFAGTLPPHLPPCPICLLFLNSKLSCLFNYTCGTVRQPASVPMTVCSETGTNSLSPAWQPTAFALPHWQPLCKRLMLPRI